jgi:hypothetical protein
MSLVTLFTAPKPFTVPHIAMIQRNAIRSWMQLSPEVEIILVGDEPGIAETANKLGVRYIPNVVRNSTGTPLISSMFALARDAGAAPILAIINTDILLMPDFVTSILKVMEARKEFVLMGQRWDLDVQEEMDFSLGWEDRLQEKIKRSGRLHPRGGSDYFIFPRSCFGKIPDFAIGRAGWDNWMIYEARRRGWRAVDATDAIRIVHQDHDYSHLPGGQPHYRLSESSDNVRLAGGRRTIFTLMDTSHRLVGDKILPAASSWKKFWREVEIFPLIHLRSYALAQIFYTIFHPQKAYREFRKSLRNKAGEGNA